MISPSSLSVISHALGLMKLANVTKVKIDLTQDDLAAVRLAMLEVNNAIAVLTAPPPSERPAPQDHLPPNRAARRRGQRTNGKTAQPESVVEPEPEPVVEP